MIFHIAFYSEWKSFAGSDTYWPAGFEREGFIHACLRHQIDGVLARHFEGKAGLCLLSIDPERLESELRFEPGPDHETYPHIYGPIQKPAIVDIQVM